MKTWCERNVQVEVGVVEHEGHTFAALGASVQGRYVTGYTNRKNRQISLKTWCGKMMLACRSEVVQKYHDGAVVIVFRLTRGRFIVGYALGDHGMLFRGELVTDCTDQEARQTAREIARHFAELDAEDDSDWQEDHD